MFGPAASGGVESLPCLQNLSPCQPCLKGPYIAPAICCEQLKETITHDLKCLCGILAHTDVLKSFNITQVELMKLRKDCAINLTQSDAMEQEMIDGLQNMCLMKEEEEGIPITTRSKLDLLEECFLSLFGRLLLDRQQNQKALKSNLRSTWKMGSKLKIVDVGNSILQFKFSSRCQMEWVENSGPWNFENNLLLLCRWKKGLSISNMVFTHSLF
nr:hypothetical protein CFP56_32961 [Quercus suber]